MSRFTALDDWLGWMETLHPVEIDLGLERVYQVARELNLIEPPSHISHECSGALSSISSTTKSTTVFTVAGTNGKGTCTATLTTCLCAAGYTVGTYTSPHFNHYAERICINGEPVEDALICEAFAAIDAARQTISLSYFEFGTLAALWIFVQQQVSYVVLEVGLGGRLDAVNIVDTDVAIVTSIDMDHQDWLGNDRDSIAKEKLGIARKDKPLIITEQSLTPALTHAAENYPSRVINRDFFVRQSAQALATLEYEAKSISLNTKGLHPNSVSAALIALASQGLLSDAEKLMPCLNDLSIAGRCEPDTFNGTDLIFDVAHNPAAVKSLKQHLDTMPCAGKNIYVMAIMADKDFPEVIRHLKDDQCCWFVGDLNDNSRALPATQLASELTAQQQLVSVFDNIEQAFNAATTHCKAHDRIVVLGSFFTVSAVKNYIASLTGQASKG